MQNVAEKAMQHSSSCVTALYSAGYSESHSKAGNLGKYGRGPLNPKLINPKP